MVSIICNRAPWRQMVWLCALAFVLGHVGLANAQDSGAVGESTSEQTSQSLPDALPVVLAVRVTSTEERARLIVDLAATTQFAFFSLLEPMRIAIDVRAAEYDGDATGAPAGEGLISGYEIEQVSGERLRTILTLESAAQVQQAYMLDAFDDQPARFVVDLIRDTDAQFAERVAQRGIAAGGIAAGDTNAEGAQTGDPSLESGQSVVLGQSSNLPGASNIASVTRPLILIDPGHGGLDGGAETADGVLEKSVTMAFARSLQNILIASGRFDVAMTRTGDEFLRLEERVLLARENKASLFISIHADAFADPAIRGASVYTRDERATDVLDRVLAEQENKVDLLAGFAPPETEDVVVNILVDLMRREMRRQAYAAADAIVAQLRPSTRVRRFPMRRADFFVLQSPDVPSILLELGFLSNAEDARNLTSTGWRDRVAQSVARGIALYFDGLEF